MSAAAARTLVVDLRSRARSWALTDDAERAIREAAPRGWSIVVVQAPTVSDGDGGRPPSDEALEAVRDAEAYFGFGVARPLFLAARRLRWAHSGSAGVGGALFPEMLASDVLLTNSAGVHAVPIAEHVMGGVIHFLRGFDVAIAQQRRGEWSKAPFVEEGAAVRELSECRALVVGSGGLGQAIAERLAALGARVTGLRRRPELGAPRGFERVAGLADLDRELPHADVLVLAAPHTPETAGLMTAARLDLLPRDAVFANVARGTLVDERALAERLAAGRLRGAVLDVFAEEPLAPGSPLWQLERVLLTPHVAAVSPRRYWERALELFRDNWHRYDEGRPLRNLVDKRAGY